MEFPFNVNSILREEITIMDCSTITEKHYSNHMKQIEVAPKCPSNEACCACNVFKLKIILCEIGKLSAKAQKLPGPITNLTKMMVNQQRIYILKDENANNGLGIVLGFLKTGRKKLFLIDYDGKHNEECPICILDFYVHESLQRRGFGLKLFNFMIKTENVSPVELAVDRPSSKFTAFLRKHFKLWANIPQVNNFVIFEGFFKRKRSSQYSKQNNLLNRAASEDMIKRNRQNTNEVPHYPFHSNDSNIYHSETMLNRHSSYGTRRHHRFEPNVKRNLYSRYNTEQSNYISQRKMQSAGDRENILNNKNDSPVLVSPELRQSPIITKSNQPLSHQKNANTTKSPENQNTKDDVRTITPVKTSTYAKPNDMISELRQKDNERKTLFQRYPGVKGYQYYSTSWNVLGVPPLQLRR